MESKSRWQTPSRRARIRPAFRASWILLPVLLACVASVQADEPTVVGGRAAPATPPGVAAAALESAQPRPARTPGRIQPNLIDLQGTWQPNGPAPIANGQIEGVGLATPTPNPVVGAVHDVAPHPTNANILYLGAANGGVWKTVNAAAPGGPSWVPLTDTQAAQCIGVLEFDATDATGNTLVAGVGRVSSLGRLGGPLTGLLRTTDAGNTWTAISPPLLQGESISGVFASGPVLVATATSFNGSFGTGGVFRSPDGGTTWSALSGAVGSGIPAPPVGAFDDVYDLVEDPSQAGRLYIAVNVQGVFRSDDSGQTWQNITSGDVPLTAALTQPSAGAPTYGNNNTELAVASNGRVFVAVVKDGRANYIGYTDNPLAGAGTTWTPMDLPRMVEADGTTWGLNPRVKPGGQGAIHFSIAADPTTPNTVYVGGDRQPNSGVSPFWPNSIGANDYSGRLFRGDTTVLATGGVPSPQWEHLTHSNAILTVPGGGTASGSAPHADSRDMAFDANGELIEGDDGGIYRRTLPGSNTGDWVSLCGNVQVTEIHDIAWDPVSKVLQCGNQDTGTAVQSSAATPALWSSVPWLSPAGFYTGDGGDVEIGTSVTPGASDRFVSYQNLGFARVQTWSPGNLLTAEFTPGLAGSGPPPISWAFTPQFYSPVELNALAPTDPTARTRVVICGSWGVYESFDRGNTLTFVPHAGTPADDNVAWIQPNDWGTGDALAYGGNGPGGPNPDVIYAGVAIVGASSGNYLLIRTTAAGALTASPAYAGGRIVDLALNPADWQHAYVLDSDQVFETRDAGATMADITGDLNAAGAGTLQSVVFVPDTVADGVVVGTDAGIFVSRRDSAGNFGRWARMGVGLPNVPVYDVQYAPPPDDLLVAGTLGRGAWVLQGATAATDTVDPLAQVSVNLGTVWPADTTMVPVGAAVAFSDNFDPANTLAKTLTVTSNEANGPPPLAPDGVLTVGPPPTLQLRAERDVPGAGNGRVYLVHTRATDVSGNTGHACASVLVPTVPTVTTLTMLKDEGTRAESACLANGAAQAPHDQSIIPTTNLP